MTPSPPKKDWFDEHAPQDDWFAEHAPNKELIDYNQPAEQSNLSKAGNAVRDFGEGVGSGVASTGVGAYDLLRKIPGVDKALPPVSATVREATKPPDYSTLGWPGQAGKTVEQGAEFFAPGGLVNRGAKALRTGNQVLNIGSRAGLEGLAAAGVTGVQTGGDTKQMKKAGLTTAAISSAVPLLGTALQALKIPENLYQSALKPGARVGNTDKVDRVIQTGLREEIPVSRVGVDKLYDRVDTLDNSVSGRIHQGTVQGQTVDPYPVSARVDQVVPTFKNQVNPQTDLKALEVAKRKFLRSQGARPGTAAGPPQPITNPQGQPLLNAQGQPVMGPGTPAVPPTRAQPMLPDAAHAMKQGTYQHLRKKYGQLSEASIEGQKALARGIREELVNLFPEIKTPMSLEADLMKLSSPLENRVRVTGNHDVMGIGTPIAGAATAAVTHSTPLGLAATLLKSITDNPAMKSHLAIIINKAGKGTGLTPSAIMGRLAAYAAQEDPETKDESGDTIPRFARGGVVVPKPRVNVHVKVKVGVRKSKLGRRSKRGIWYGPPHPPKPVADVPMPRIPRSK